ncbi:MAG: LamG-like jellyroll fold domain-containing protein [Planctomycetota bacterium]|nr:LamG-like jellyroll fold domain-containing protein [Planctomycetota bacterium]
MKTRSNILILGLLFLLHSGATAGDPVRTDRKDARPLTAPDGESMWQFAIMGDRTGGPAEGIRVLARAVNEVNLVEPDLVMTVGDLIQGYNSRVEWLIQAKQFQDTMNRLSRPWYPVAGNHDIYWRGPDRPEGEHESNYEQHFGPLWYWFEHKGCGFIILYSDEGDPVSGKKNFSDPKCQRFSATQLEWLDRVLDETKSLETVFVFLHHPRWISNHYKGANWEDVHQRLVLSGNVAAVFGGHIHRLHYAGVRDGIAYHTLATTGGHRSRDYAGAGWVHHWNLVTVRPGGVDIAVVPVGSLLDPRHFTPERRALSERLLADDLVRFAEAIPAPSRALYGVDSVLSLKNPVASTIRMKFKSPDGRIEIPIPEVVLDAHSTRQLPVKVDLDEVLLSGKGDLPFLEVAIQFDDEHQRGVVVPTRRIAITLDHQQWDARNPDGGHLVLTGGGDCIKLNSSQVPLAQGAFTVEGWVQAADYSGRRPFITKTEGSEYGIFLSDGVPSFMVHLDGKYHVVEAEGVHLQSDRWHHVAGVYDGGQLRIYLDGNLVGSRSASGQRTLNRLPLVVGGDPDKNGNAVDTLQGTIDGVRLSRGALYTQESFTPAVDFPADADTVALLTLDRSLAGMVQVEGTRGQDSKVARITGDGRCEAGSAMLP